jgi:hypothetical protein
VGGYRCLCRCFASAAAGLDGGRHHLAMAEHWQREIAYFDLFIAFVFGWSARQSDIRIKRAATMLLCGLSLLLGENHLEGWLTEARPFHVLFTLGNGLAVLWGVVACFSVRKVLEQA